MIGLMLDHSASAATFWAAEQLPRDFEASYATRGEDPEMLLTELIENDEELELFWPGSRRQRRSGHYWRSPAL